MLLFNEDGATNINDEHFAAAGVFDLPDDVATHLLRFPGWRNANQAEVEAYLAALEQDDSSDDTGPDFEHMKIADLQQFAADNSIDLGDAKKKADMAAAIRTHLAAAAAAETDAEDDASDEADPDDSSDDTGE